MSSLRTPRVQRRHLITELMKQADGNQAQAARLLGLTYHQFRYYLGKYASMGGPG